MTVELDSSFLDWEWASCPEAVALWIHILFLASEEDRRWRGIDIPRGSFVTTYRNLAEMTGMTINKLRTNLNRLVLSDLIKMKITQKLTMISICEYDSYKGLKNGNHTIITQKTHDNHTIITQLGVCESNSYEDLKNENGEIPAETCDNCQENAIVYNYNKNISLKEIDKERKGISKDIPQRKKEKEKNNYGFDGLEESISAVVCRKKPELDISFVMPELQDVFREFMDMRRKIGKPLKTPIGVKARYNRLLSLSGGDVPLAISIARQTIENEWQDFYSLKTERQNGPPQNYSSDKYWK